MSTNASYVIGTPLGFRSNITAHVRALQKSLIYRWSSENYFPVLAGSVEPGKLYYPVGQELPARDEDLKAAMEIMDAELHGMLPEWRRAVENDGPAPQYLAYIFAKGEAVGFSSILRGESFYDMTAMSNAPSELLDSHALGIKHARRLLLRQRKEAIKKLQALGL